MVGKSLKLARTNIQPKCSRLSFSSVTSGLRYSSIIAKGKVSRPTGHIPALAFKNHLRQLFAESWRVGQILAPKERIPIEQALCPARRTEPTRVLKKIPGALWNPENSPTSSSSTAMCFRCRQGKLNDVKVLQTFVRGRKVFDRLAPKDVQSQMDAILLISFTAGNLSLIHI